KLLFNFLRPDFVLLDEPDLRLLVRASGRVFTLAERPPAEQATLRRLAQLGLLLTESAVERAYRYDRASIEINSHCNYRCVFCPVATAPPPKRVMDPALYDLICRRVAEAGIGIVVLNHYGEPSLDPHLVDRVRVARDHGLTVDLYSNVSRLDGEKSRA